MKKFLAISIVLAITFGVTPSFAATPKAGSTCTKLTSTVTSGANKLVCVAVGAKNIWRVSSAAQSRYVPKGWLVDRCFEEDGLKGYAAKLQSFLVKDRRCISAMRVVKASLPKSRPASVNSPDPTLAPLETCKLLNATNSNNWKGFPAPGKVEEFNLKRHPSPKTVMQVIPIYSSDAPKGGKSPEEDYKFYFDFLRDYFKYSNDGPGNFELRVPKTYFEFSKPIEPYEIEHGKDDDLSRAFFQDVISSVDAKFDFNEINYSLIVVPGGTPSGVLGQQGTGRVLTNEGYVTNVSSAQPSTLSGPNNTLNIWASTPTMWIHELYHPGMNLGDNHAGNSDLYDSERGMGDWGLMSRNNGDLLAWQKWILGFVQDSQVRCVDRFATSTTSWIAPSSMKTTMNKLVVVPLSSQKAIVVESIRALGLSYKYSRESLGALVYILDESDSRHDYGYTVMYPDNRRPSGGRYPMRDAPLKVGESLTYEGVKITNVEWGDFGDVIKVEPVK